MYCIHMYVTSDSLLLDVITEKTATQHEEILFRIQPTYRIHM